MEPHPHPLTDAQSGPPGQRRRSAVPCEAGEHCSCGGGSRGAAQTLHPTVPLGGPQPATHGLRPAQASRAAGGEGGRVCLDL